MGAAAWSGFFFDANPPPRLTPSARLRTGYVENPQARCARKATSVKVMEQRMEDECVTASDAAFAIFFLWNERSHFDSSVLDRVRYYYGTYLPSSLSSHHCSKKASCVNPTT